MSEPRGPRTSRSADRRGGDSGNGNVAADAATSTVRGIFLILIAIGVGIFFLNVFDPGSDSTAIKEPTASSTTKPPKGSTTTAPDTTELVPHDQLRIQVLNGRGVSGVAGQTTEALKAQGYTNAADPGNVEERTGDLVACKAGLQQEAAELAQLVGDNVEVGAFPDPAPADTGDDVQCLVILGKPAEPAQ